VLVAAAQKELGRVHCAQAEKHLSRRNHALGAIFVGGVEAELEAVLGGGDPRDLAARPDLSAHRFGDGEVVEVERVLGADVAADVALAAVEAARLKRAELVRGRRLAGAVEAHGDVRAEELGAPAEPGGGFLHQPGLGR
jgi:hypothetical protein